MKASPERALQALLRLTEAGSESWRRADRALTLHMLHGHAPRFFDQQRLSRTLEAALRGLAAVPSRLDAHLPPAEAMARVDAAWLRAQHRMGRHGLDGQQLRECLLGLALYHHPIWAAVAGELGRDLGLEVSQPTREADVVLGDPTVEVYWITHLVLSRTQYLRWPLQTAGLERRLDQLARRARWMVAAAYLDLAAESAFCLQAAGRQRTGACTRLIEMIEQRQRRDGSFVDLSAATTDRHERQRLKAHATAAALVALAGAQEGVSACAASPRRPRPTPRGGRA